MPGRQVETDPAAEVAALKQGAGKDNAATFNLKLEKAQSFDRGAVLLDYRAPTGE